MRLRLSSPPPPPAREPADGGSDLYTSVCDRDLTQWPTPRQLLGSAVFENRTECLPCAGGLWGRKEKTLKLLVLRYIRKRMSKERAQVIEAEHLEWHLYGLREASCDLWQGVVEPPLQPRLRPPQPPDGAVAS